MKGLNRFIFSMFIFVAIVSGLVFAGGAQEEKQGRGGIEKIVYAYVSFNNIPEDLTDVEEYINTITRDKIGVEVELKPLSIASYTQQINLAMAGGEQVDIFHSLGDFAQSVSKSQAYDLTDMLMDNASEIIEQIGSDMLKTTTVDGRVYGIPADKGYAIAPTFMYRADILEEIGVDPSSIKNVYDLTSVFEKVKKAYPDMIPLSPVNQGDCGIMLTIDEVDYLTDDMFFPKGVLMGNSREVVDFYQTEEFMKRAKLLRDWSKKGYISKDASTTNVLAAEALTSGLAFSFVASYPGTDAPMQIAAQTGQDINGIRLDEPYLATSNINLITWMISSTTKHPEAALRFLNLTYTDSDIINAIVYGLEGRDYVKTGDRTVTWPESLDAQSVPYTAQLSCGIVGSQFMQYVVEGADIESLNVMRLENKSSGMSEAFGFIFDPSSVKNEYTAVINVINQYFPGLRCGSFDLEKEYPEFINKIHQAGLTEIIAEKQRQLDLWFNQQ